MVIATDSRALRLMRCCAPATPNQLHAYVRVMLGFDVPLKPIVSGHSAPFDYLRHAFFEDAPGPRDCVVWANRGGGKSQLAAVATLLDMLFKPGIQVRVLGGSFEQSSKVYNYLRRLLERDAFKDLIQGRMCGRYVQLVNGSRVEVLSQSERSVRGQRVHKLRCDEVELFETPIWQAAQLTTRSGPCGGVNVRAAIEALSTMHEPFGLMQELTRQAEAGTRTLFRWSLLDTIALCPPRRACAGCTLWGDCRGRAKRNLCGFIDIDDAIQQQGRVGEETWAAEVLCQRPSRSHTVYPRFDPKVHVVREDGLRLAGSISSRGGRTAAPPPVCVAGLDFGFRSPTAMVFAHLDDEGGATIVDEVHEREMPAEQFIELAMRRSRAWGRPEWIGADPAGHQRNDQSGVSTIALWRAAGFTIRTRGTTIEAGVAAVRRWLSPAGGRAPLLRIHERCVRLIEALRQYHYEPPAPGDDLRHAPQPVKDGHDHIADALRYLVVNAQAGELMHGRKY